MQRWHILGVGAIGGLFASLLQEAGTRCTLLLRDSDPDLAEGTTCITLRRGERLHSYQFEASASADASPISHLLVCTKAQDIIPAIAGVAHRLAPDAVVLLLANGLGYQQQVRARWPQLDCFSGSTTEGVFREGRRAICHAGRGSTLVGQPGRETAPGWFDAWLALPIQCGWSRDIDTVLWRKLAINCAINPLTALHGCPNGELAQRAELAALVGELCAEIRAIGIAAGQEQAVSDLQTQVMAVISATANNRSSMLQDVLAGRETEIDYLTGHLLAQGREHGIEAPRNAALLAAVKALRAGTRPA
ncbi:2-dehydropantoate 2-reductase [Haliea sp. E1-2-M8]|uniref:2-dehydropantoate 2-reductase n=1 Tax=Haliea sp. E1-2-M8 TaxID=3064706 RepID=UPI0027244C86|nr:2-dehydropantoate 2-reductase [Haliea sp. E1-2-M8]MDO8861426.1 2-dehydropantoate 2-reductase [Haliea sp. E1-2-M8]